MIDRIKLGMELLDRADPSWREKIDLTELDMSDHKHCILGQLYGDYDDGKLILCPDTGFDSMEDWATINGFQAQLIPYESYDELTRLWKEALSK